MQTLLRLILDIISNVKFSATSHQFLINQKRQLRVNFIKILCTLFLHKGKLSSFSLLMFGFVIFWHQISGAKFARKLLMKLTEDAKCLSKSVFVEALL